MCIYFKHRIVVKSRKLSGVIERHCVSLDFADDEEESDGGKFQEKFANYIRTIEEHLNSEPIEKQLGESDVNDSTKAISGNYRIP